MEQTKRIGDLEITEDAALERRTWAVQRIGWVAMLVFLVAALMGVFGSGLLSDGQKGKPGDPFSIEYQRFGRMRVEDYLRVYVAGSFVHDDKVQVWLNRDYLHNRIVQQTVPEAESTDVTTDRVTYTFDVSDTAHPVEITFVISPDEIGARTGQVGIEDGPDYRFDQFIYP